MRQKVLIWIGVVVVGLALALAIGAVGLWWIFRELHFS